MVLTANERTTIEQFLAGAWYDRSEDDDEIVAEWVEMASAREIMQTLNALAAVLPREEDREELAKLIRSSAWRWFRDDVEEPLSWLREVYDLLEAEAKRQGKFQR